ncbi:MAG: type II toxin-antitoxin system RelE/ParE family toxin [Candidatus Omnitrophica bacterium]|nr:type II toxin-antitoxin system RelE/ParE family toxin [Candidatus Omnitrophota bacterium]
MLKRLEFVGSSKDDLSGFPEAVKLDIGFALFEIQQGRTPLSTKPLRGFGGAGVLEIIEDAAEGTYRAVCTVRFERAVYVLHCFQKKSRHGIETPQRDIELIRWRLAAAERDYRARNS